MLTTGLRRLFPAAQQTRLMASAAMQAKSPAEGAEKKPQAYVSRVFINNEKKRNALSLAVLEDLENQLKAINPNWDYQDGNWLDLDNIEESMSKVNRKCKVVVLESAGAVFCSGWVFLREEMEIKWKSDVLT